MNKTFVFLPIFIVILACQQFSSTQSKGELKVNTTTTYYFIRHAEKELSGDNPNLTEEGKRHAEAWSSYFSDKSLDLIYSTDFNRTQQTAKAVSDKTGISVFSYDVNQSYTETFKKETLGKNVLIVGHSNTIPGFVNDIIGENKYSDLDEENYDSLFTVILKDDRATSSVTTIND